MLRHRAKLQLPCNLKSGSVWPMQDFCMPYISLLCNCNLFIQSGILVSCLLDISFNVKIHVGWGCIVNCFMLSSLPCFYAFADLLSIHLVTFLMFSVLFSCHFFKQQMHASLSSQASLVDVCSIGWRIIDQTRLSSNTPCTPAVFLKQSCIIITFRC